MSLRMLTLLPTLNNVDDVIVNTNDISVNVDDILATHTHTHVVHMYS